MNTGRRASDWLRLAPAAPKSDGERSGLDRRAADRRAPRRKLDSIFVATLINQIAPAATPAAFAYEPAPTQPRRGASVNFRA